MRRVFLALVVVITATAMFPSFASAQQVRERVYVREEHVRIRQGGPPMMPGHRYDSISDGYRGYLAINLIFGPRGERRYQSFEPVRRVEPGDCFVRVDRRRPEDDLKAEVDRMTGMCIADARARGWPPPRVVVELY